jgi:hypothetical protein
MKSSVASEIFVVNTLFLHTFGTFIREFFYLALFGSDPQLNSEWLKGQIQIWNKSFRKHKIRIIYHVDDYKRMI